MTIKTQARALFLLASLAGAPRITPACTAEGVDPRFDALDCVELRTSAAAGGPVHVLLNRCSAPIAMLVVVCDLAAQPACRTDPVSSRGWNTRGEVEYLASAHVGMQNIQRGWRAQIAACRMRGESGLVAADPCALRLAALKRSLDGSGGKSMRAVLAERRKRCST